MSRDDPISIANYGNDNDLLQQPGWKHLRMHVRNNKHSYKAIVNKLKLIRGSTKIKFGITIPSNHNEAMKLDKDNGNNKWKIAETTELQQQYEYGTFQSLGMRLS